MFYDTGSLLDGLFFFSFINGDSTCFTADIQSGWVHTALLLMLARKPTQANGGGS